MKVALDATPLALSSGGLRRYTAELSRALAQSFLEDEYLLVSDQPFEFPGGFSNLSAGAQPANALDRRWWFAGLTRELGRKRIDVFHGTNFEVPYLPLRPAVLTLHDLSPWLDPSWHDGANRVRTRTPALIKWGLASAILTPSQAVRRSAIDHFRLHPDRVFAVPHGGIPTDWAVPARGRPEGAPGYFLYVGTLESRKNLGTLLAAWREVNRQYPVELWLVGKARPEFPPIPGEPGLRVLGEVADGRLPKLYADALALVYPSLYEGFGMPVLEAMQCGSAVIASRDPAVSEVAEPAAIQVEAHDVRGWIQALSAVVADRATLEEWRAKASRRGKMFSWRNTAERTREVYEYACRRFDG
jgi:glycosyltransferase involved in cell wall biosynthesis